ncbi:LacI family transcriptional regulator [Aliiruegeria haliotis]|uniref:LacI family transcriptional regulator n=1 Tax=Aliiruegeria haliotis TaxID=1280846 RepID=A0A2T0RLV1_9RHOB|nr:LacI family DNA-binding transcriptional regulator [Aliiruegeria haliotis]PRY22169.1 LacI family transcriptional regulator [Aliiruegeria haliotis]
MTRRTGKHATISDVAQRAGVAKSTASLSFSAPERVSADTLERVLSAARAIGYAPNAMAQSLKSGRNKLIGFMVSDMRNPHNGSILRAVQENAAQQGFLVITATSDDSPDREREILRRFQSMRIRGAILTASGNDAQYVEELTSLPMTFVTFDQHLDGLACDHVGLDNRLAVRMLTRHLLDLGHRRIAHIAGTPGLWTARERLEGIRETMSEAGLPLPDDLVVNGQFRSEPSYAQALHLLNRPEPPTAIITANNTSAHGALKAVRALGLRCPEDVSLASVDNLPWSDLIEPRVTCTAQPVSKMAAKATGWLLERLALPGADTGQPPREAFMVPELELGGSTAPPRAR